ncbi:hypothetical protein HDU76_005302 [Blyttiomyces sp. JEL0837]|nr:hypothetical protein HDU76_005302 [Blyttiomyces sp. JEL0837]
MRRTQLPLQHEKLEGINALTLANQEEINAPTTTTTAPTTTTTASTPSPQLPMPATDDEWALTEQEKELQTKIAFWHRTEFQFILWENDRDKILAKFGSSNAWDESTPDIHKEELLEFRYRAIYNSFLLKPLEWLRNTPSVQSASFSILYNEELSDETLSSINRMAGATSHFFPTVSFVQPAMDELQFIVGGRNNIVEADGLKKGLN